MNLDKIHNIISKAVFDLKAHKLLMCTSNSHVCIGDSHHVYKIDKNEFLFSTTTLLIKGVRESKTFNIIFDNIPDTPAIKTGNLRDGFKPNYPFIQLKAGEELIYVDAQLLKNFDKGCTFTGTNGKSPVYVWESGECVGMVLPVYIKD